MMKRWKVLWPDLVVLWHTVPRWWRLLSLQLYTTTNNQRPKIPAWMNLMGRVTNHLKIKPVVSTTTKTTRVASTTTTVRTSPTTTTTTSDNLPPIHMVSPVEEVVKTESLVKTLLLRWSSQIKTGKRREAKHTLSTLVISTTNPKRNLPKMAKFLCESKVDVGSEVVKKTKGPKNPG